MSGEPYYAAADEAEQELLGACLTDPRALAAVRPVIDARDFQIPARAMLYMALCRLADQDKRPSTIAIVDEMRRSGRGDQDLQADAATVLALGMRRVPGAHAEPAASVMLGYSELRELRRTLQHHDEIAARAASSQVREIVAAAQEGVLRIREVEQSGVAASIGGLSDRWIERFRTKHDRPPEEQQFAGILSGLADWDRLTRGWRTGHLDVCGAKTGAGKTALACHFAWNAALLSRVGVLHVSLEVPAMDLLDRTYSMLTEINGEVIQTGGVTDPELRAVLDARGRIAELRHGIWILDKAHVSIADIETNVRLIRSIPGVPPIKFVIIDYLGLVRPSRWHKDEEQRVADVADGAMNLAKRQDVAVLAFSQLNRNDSKRIDKLPELSDLRYSDRVSHDASRVFFLHRPVMFNAAAPKTDAILPLRKNRMGRCGNVDVWYDATTNRFRNKVHHFQVQAGDTAP